MSSGAHFLNGGKSRTTERICNWLVEGKIMEQKSSDFSAYLAYHVRSLNIVLESALKKKLKDTQLTSDAYYILIANWSKQSLTLHELSAYANLSIKQAERAVNTLFEMGLLKSTKNSNIASLGSYQLTKEGEALNSQLLLKRELFLAKALKSTPEADIQTALSVLMKLQDNISGLSSDLS